MELTKVVMLKKNNCVEKSYNVQQMLNLFCVDTHLSGGHHFRPVQTLFFNSLNLWTYRQQWSLAEDSRMSAYDKFCYTVSCPCTTGFTVFLIVFRKKSIGYVLDVYAVNYHSKCQIFVTC